jgi:hypothetical protein
VDIDEQPSPTDHLPFGISVPMKLAPVIGSAVREWLRDYAEGAWGVLVLPDHRLDDGLRVEVLFELEEDAAFFRLSWL